MPNHKAKRPNTASQEIMIESDEEQIQEEKPLDDHPEHYDDEHYHDRLVEQMQRQHDNYPNPPIGMNPVVNSQANHDPFATMPVISSHLYTYQSSKHSNTEPQSNPFSTSL